MNRLFPSKVRPRLCGLFVVACLVSPSGVGASGQAADSGVIEAIVAGDARVARIGYRLVTANAARCSRLMPELGLVAQGLDQFEARYRAVAARALPFRAPLAVEYVVPGGPAAGAGIMRGDGVIAVDGAALPADAPATGAATSSAGVERYYAVMTVRPPDVAVTLRLARADGERAVTLMPHPACRSRFELVLGRGVFANADGETVRIGAGLLERVDDEGLAILLSHELAHNILGHARQQEELGVRGGIAGEVGASAKQLLRMEDEADRLSLRLLADAGYDPRSAARFWRSTGRKLAPLAIGGSHRGWRERAALLDAEAATLARDAQPAPR